MCKHEKEEMVKTIMSDGNEQRYLRCKICKQQTSLPLPHYLFKPDDEIIVGRDYSKNSQPCFVCKKNGIENKKTQNHHFAPRSLFDDSEYWPQEYLCKEHHRLWHKKMKTPGWELMYQEVQDV